MNPTTIASVLDLATRDKGTVEIILGSTSLTVNPSAYKLVPVNMSGDKSSAHVGTSPTFHVKGKLLTAGEEAVDGVLSFDAANVTGVFHLNGKLP